MDEVAVDRLEVRPSGIHGQGVYATGLIRAGERVIEYFGEKITKEESQSRCCEGNHYIFYLSERYDLDGSAEANVARLINHSCAPNTEAEVENERIWIVALRDITPGEEISFNYGYDLEDFRDHPCRCGAANCVGYILAEEYWSSVPDEAQSLSDAAPERLPP
jgi:uncharacterized protein